MRLEYFKQLKSLWQAHKPLGWAQLSHQKMRFSVALTGVTFSNILIFTQLGIRALLFEGITFLPERLAGDLFLMSAYAPNIESGGFSKSYLYKADAVEGVASTSPIYLESANWLDPLDLGRPVGAEESSDQQTLLPNIVKIIALNPVRPTLAIPEVNQQLNKLSASDTVLYDRLAQNKLGPVAELYAQQGNVHSIMDNRRINVVGLFSLGSTVFDNGNVIMSDWTFARRYGQNRLNQVNVGSIFLEPDADLEQVQQRLTATLSDNVKILTKAELIEQEIAVQTSDPLGKIFNFGAVIGFVVGVIIVYQVLYTDVSDHLPEYAALKAMGHPDRALLGVVFQEALILAVLGFIPGYGLSYGVYGLLSWVTQIPLNMKVGVTVQVFTLTLVMCLMSGAIAINKLRAADPADIF